MKQMFRLTALCLLLLAPSFPAFAQYDTRAKAAYMVDLTTGTVLLEKEPHLFEELLAKVARVDPCNPAGDPVAFVLTVSFAECRVTGQIRARSFPAEFAA